MLDTFPNLTVISIDHGDISLATADVAQKLCTLPQLRILRFNSTRIFSNTSNSANYDFINEWLLCFPKSLEIMSFLNTKILMGDNPQNRDLAVTLDGMRNRTVSRFYDFLPNLKEIEIIFQSRSSDLGDAWFYI